MRPLVRQEEVRLVRAEGEWFDHRPVARPAQHADGARGRQSVAEAADGDEKDKARSDAQSAGEEERLSRRRARERLRV
jgi:hypothetical protein